MSDRPIQLLLVDNDPVFQLGFSSALEPFNDLQVVAQLDTATAALERLAEQTGENAPDLVVLELGIGRSSPHQISGLQLCQQLKNQYPHLPIFLLSAETEPEQLATALDIGIEGYCPKGIAITELVHALTQVASGETYGRESAPRAFQDDSSASTTSSPRSQPRHNWLYKQRQSGLRYIDENLAQVRAQLQKNSQLSLFDWLFWTGVRRELVVSRWLVNQLLPVEVVFVSPNQEEGEQGNSSRNAGTRGRGDKEGERVPQHQALAPTEIEQQSAITPQQSVSSAVFDSTLAKIQLGVENPSGSPLEIDVLQPDKKKELLYVVLNQVREAMEELRFLQVTPEQLPERRSLILRDLWQSSTVEFFSKYYTPTVGTYEYRIYDLMLQNAAIVQEMILNKIPLVVELFAYLVFEKPLVVENVSYRIEAPEAKARAEALLQNMSVQIANSVMQLLLNNFPEVEEVKESLYSRRFFSSREITRFRNNLSWKYRQDYYWEEPKAIFESKYRLFVLKRNSIQTIFIYTPRQNELLQLRGIRWSVTLALETRDAIAPRLRSVVGFVGNGVFYLLTQVIGRGIGLIGRGIVQGLGTTLQDTRYRKDGERGK